MNEQTGASGETQALANGSLVAEAVAQQLEAMLSAGNYDGVYSLARELLSIFESGLGLAPGTLLKHVTAPPSQLRLLKYFENDAPADRLHHGIDAHSDFECLTILHATHPGLQLLSANDHWVETPPMEGCFTILVGDCIEAWTGGDLKATQHRVVNRGAERFSLPFFFSADYDLSLIHI